MTKHQDHYTSQTMNHVFPSSDERSNVHSAPAGRCPYCCFLPPPSIHPLSLLLTYAIVIHFDYLSFCFYPFPSKNYCVCRSPPTTLPTQLPSWFTSHALNPIPPPAASPSPRATSPPPIYSLSTSPSNIPRPVFPPTPPASTHQSHLRLTPTIPTLCCPRLISEI